MKLLFGILFAVFALCLAEPNCTRNGVSCPDYEVLETHNGYETRRYPELTVVSTTGRATERKRIIRRRIMKLYRYIGGYNKENTEIELMVPVRTLKSSGDIYNNYTISFFLPKEFSANPPEPLDSRVFLKKEPATEYAVRSFGNFARDERIWDREAKALFDDLPEGVVDSTDYFWVLYDPPVRHRDRLNEVWVRLSNQENAVIF